MGLTLVALAILTAAAWPIGGAMLARVAWPELRRYERASLQLLAGYGGASVLLTATLLVHAFWTATAVLAATAIAGLLIASRRVRPTGAAAAARSTLAATSPAGRAAGLTVAACAVLACLGAIAPVTDHDALSYVVPIARHASAEGALRVWSDQAPSMWPLGHTVLLAYIVATGGDRLGMLSALEWLIAIGAISALARRVCEQPENVVMAIALAIAAPAAAFQVAAAKEDMLLAGAAAAALFCVTGPRTTANAAAAGLFAGVAAAAKYPGLGVAIAIVAWIAIAWRGCRFRASAAALAAAAAIAGVWYALNLWRFGNPVAPFLFGARGTPLDAATVRTTIESYGGGRGLANFAATPLRIFAEPWRYGGRAALFHPLTYLGAAAVVVPRLRARSAPLLFMAGVLYVGWYLTLQNARLLLPAAMALAPAAADALAPVMKRSAWIASAIAAAVIGPLALAPAVGVVRAARYFSNPATYLERATEHYSGVAWANTHLDPSRHRVLSMFGALGYFEVPAIGVDPLHQLEFARSEIADHRQLLAACRRQGVTHIFTARDELADVASELRIVYENPVSRIGDVHFFRQAPFDATAIFEILPNRPP